MKSGPGPLGDLGDSWTDHISIAVDGDLKAVVMALDSIPVARAKLLMVMIASGKTQCWEF
jgi:hypothetical protein